ncbi:DinB family protein [Tenggerimyces flavus]|uniref:DinB family protein n=1 Tax=Tenggerimyces flavus TaxID=1708749 RepID=A0ABV7YN85_9ACTN|nr:DinB family protein [Tenggerimyces flavus]MBM7786250.1 hypothetical protein [Tenggerimyces flavus]
MLVYVENGVAMAFDRGSAAWTFDLDWWGVCGQGVDEEAALAELTRQVGEGLVVAERIEGDEGLFARDRLPCTEAGRQRTLAILAEVRADTIALVRACSDEVLDWDDPERQLPTYARWRTIRQLAWHVVDTESRYYLPSTGLGYREPLPNLVDELEASAGHVRSTIATMPPDAASTGWSAVKLLRRLAWHERGELEVMRAISRGHPAAGR